MQTTYDIPELVQRVKQQDLLAMKLLYQQFGQAMLNVSLRITQNRADSEDILQESFLTSFQQISKLNDSKLYGSWLKRIVVNNSIQATKKKRHFEDINNVEDWSERVETHWYRDIPFHKIKVAIDQLPNGCREVLCLFLLEDYKHKEIAELLNIAISTSKSQYRYALKLLKEKLTLRE